jgi:opacity protein-like surface antigen
MKILLLLVASILALISPALAADKAAKERKGRLQHMVAFKFKEDVSRSRIEEVEKAFGELPGRSR